MCLRELSVVAECGNGQTTDSCNSVSEPLSMVEFRNLRNLTPCPKFGCHLGVPARNLRIQGVPPSIPGVPCRISRVPRFRQSGTERDGL